MPSVMDAPERVAYVETLDLTIETIEQPQPRRAQPGFWRTLAYTITSHLRPIVRKQPAPLCSAYRPIEISADLLARQYATLYLRAICSI